MNKVQRLREILNAARISDDEIRGGVRLSASGISKISSRLNTTDDEVKHLITKLVTKVRAEHRQDVTPVFESDNIRFSYESDFLGNLTVRDGQTGEEHHVTGSDSAHIIKALSLCAPDSEAEQALLRKIFTDGHAETLEEGEDDGVSDGFMAELKNDAGSYNFPWKAEGHHGTGTAAYRATNKEFDLTVVSIRDEYGDETDVSPKTKNEIIAQAKAFIGNE